MKKIVFWTAVIGLAMTGFTFAADKPNVLLLMADDLGTQLGCYGHPLAKSPNLDRLASQGVLFERAYCQYPLCNPSRSSLLTGRSPDATRILTNGPHFRDVIGDTVTLPEFFRNNGYQVRRIGKLYHYGVPGQIGTDGLDDPQSWDGVENPRGRDKEDEPYVFSLIPGSFGGTLSWYASEGTDEEQTDGIGAGMAVKQLQEYAKTPEKPFFLAVGFYRPHTPYIAPKKYYDSYPLDAIKLPEVPQNHRKGEPDAAYLSLAKVEADLDPGLARQAIQGYHAATTFMDAQVGRVIAELDRLDLRKNTIIVFLSDHGYHLGEHGLWRKSSLFDRVPHVPLLIAAPDAGGNGHSSPRTVESLDLYPTLADLCGLTPPDFLDGVSLKPLLEKPDATWNRSAITQVWRGTFHGHSIRNERFRYTLWDEGRKGEQLYDHETDPDEYHNLADDPRFAEIKVKFKEELLKRVDPSVKPYTQKQAQK
ncbi:MAG: sulfatase [Planctomycetaceae bacterium]|nr:sulfatase [Planctomycetaceae bacterium]